jgi:transposase
MTPSILVFHNSSVRPSIKIGCTAQTLNEWVKKTEVDAGKRAGVPTDVAEKLKALLARA